MTMGRLLFLSFVLSPCSLIAQIARNSPGVAPQTIAIEDGWMLQSSAVVEQKGEVLSTMQFQPRNWYPAAVPTTVVAALVKNQVYPDPTFGMNLRSIPGTSYRIGVNFSNVAMPADSPFAVPWWYRKEFVLPATYKGRSIWLNFGGINYRADIWVNGKQIAGSEKVAGAWRAYRFNITDMALPGRTNVLAVRVYPPTENDLAITFVDWNPQPPDKNMGLWRSVEITTSGPVSLRYPTVISKLNPPANDSARLTVAALLENASRLPVRGTLKGRIEKIEFAQEVELAAGESKDVAFEPDQFRQLVVSKPRLWWPAQMGTPGTYHLSIEFDVNGAVSDRAETSFGIREVTSELNADRKRVFSINGKKILIRGGGWAPDMMLRENARRLEDELLYVRDMGLNTIRLEGKLETDRFFDLADRYGILIMAGWCCCDHWERWQKWTPQDHKIAEESLRSQMYRLRSHPSLVMWLNGSDNPPPAEVEKMYLSVEQQCRWPNPIVSSATARRSSVTGESGVKMTGPYEYVAPGYWLQDTRSGGAYGFNTETSPGPAVPPVESLRAMLPKEHLWPVDEWWNFHAGGGSFKDIRVFTEALNARYGTATGLQDFALKSQLMTYEGIRAMFEAYSRNKYTSTGVIQWMLNNAWPSLIWHLYDYYLRPAGGYFGAKKALEALHPLYSYDDRTVWVVSSQYQDARGLKLTARIFNLDMREKFSRQASVDAVADSTQKVLDLPEIPDLSPAYFLALRLEDSAGVIVGSNFYWLSTKPETLAWDKSTWYVTPTASYADFTALQQLPKVTLRVASRTEQKGQDVLTHVTLENTGTNLAFFIRLKVNRGADGYEILPVLWQDNYFSLLPGEKREVTATFRAQDLGTASAAVEVSGWNVMQ
ncbi:MAG: glycosyl hydrolase family 2 [Acidobacteriia bacterium]|nr:glycosyl hydrolase family 2 [Terriglobia bacterium]